MIVFLITISGVAISYTISESINYKVDKVFLERYKAITEEKNGDWRYISQLIDDYPKLFKMTPNVIQRYIPLYNIVYSLYRNFSVDYYSVLLENFVDWYDARIIPQNGKIDPETFEPKDENELEREYFIGYNNDKGKRVNIFFKYDGDTTYFLDDTSDEFKELPAEEQIDLFMEILYDIYMGRTKDYFYSQSIREIFNAQLVALLISINEEIDYDMYFKENEMEEEPLVRKRTE